MKNRIPNILTGFAKRKQSAVYQVTTFIAGFVVFMLLLPTVFLYAGKFLNRWISISCTRELELILAAISAAIGLPTMLWTVLTQFIVGRGGPVPIAPTKQLITTGPYAYCRNPLQLGAFFYYFAFGTFLGNLTIGLVCIMLEIILLLAYTKGIEEKELAIRFGQEYLEYKKNTPFLIPKIKKL